MSDDETFSIRLVYENGKPVEYGEVTVCYPGFQSRQNSTDDNGWVTFPTLGRGITEESYLDKATFLASTRLKLSNGEEVYHGATFSFTVNQV